MAEHKDGLLLQSPMPVNSVNPAARRAAATMLARYDTDALAIAEREVAARIAANDVDQALEMDQVRRELVFLLRE